jgi:hypothetical protein
MQMLPVNITIEIHCAVLQAKRHMILLQEAKETQEKRLLTDSISLSTAKPHGLLHKTLTEDVVNSTQKIKEYESKINVRFCEIESFKQKYPSVQLEDSIQEIDKKLTQLSYQKLSQMPQENISLIIKFEFLKAIQSKQQISLTLKRHQENFEKCNIQLQTTVTNSLLYPILIQDIMNAEKSIETFSMKIKECQEIIDKHIYLFPEYDLSKIPTNAELNMLKQEIQIMNFISMQN